MKKITVGKRLFLKHKYSSFLDPLLHISVNEGNHLSESKMWEKNIVIYLNYEKIKVFKMKHIISL